MRAHSQHERHPSKYRRQHKESAPHSRLECTEVAIDISADKGSERHHRLFQQVRQNVNCILLPPPLLLEFTAGSGFCFLACFFFGALPPYAAQRHKTDKAIYDVGNQRQALCVINTIVLLSLFVCQYLEQQRVSVCGETTDLMMVTATIRKDQYVYIFLSYFVLD